MSSKWIRKGDKVAVIAGNEKGQVAKVLAIRDQKVILEGLNIRKKHVKPKQKMQPGIVEMETPIHISNVSLCTDEGKAIKVHCKTLKDGKKQLIYRREGKEVVFREVKTKKSK